MTEVEINQSLDFVSVLRETLPNMSESVDQLEKTLEYLRDSREPIEGEAA